MRWRNAQIRHNFFEEELPVVFRMRWGVDI
jgi:hypothetical protein